MTPPNNKVSQQQFYTEFAEFRKERVEALTGVEIRLGGKIDSLAAEIRAQNQNQGERIVALEEGARGHQSRMNVIDGVQGSIATLDAKVDKLEAGENRWKAVTGLLGVVSGALTGWLTGR